MKVIGITGGIGSGKSLVTEILQKEYGAKVFHSDRIAKKQMEPGGESYQGVVGYFGKGILHEDGRISSEKLSRIVFRDSSQLIKLNELTHPPVIHYLKNQIQLLRKEPGVPFMVIETALIIESGLDAICDVVWYVRASEEIRRKRLKSSRNYSDEKVDAIFASQCKEEDFLVRYKAVIDNNGGVDILRKQVDELIARLK